MDDQGRAVLYAQFEGDEVDGKTYALGEPLADAVDAGTRAYMSSIGRFSATKPAASIVMPSPDKALVDMSRAELEAVFRSEMPLHKASDEDLIREINRLREGKEFESTDDSGDDDDILSGTIATISVALDDIEDLPALAALRDRENAAAKPRAGVLSAIDERVAEVRADELEKADTARLREIASVEGVEGLADDATDATIREAITAKRAGK